MFKIISIAVALYTLFKLIVPKKKINAQAPSGKSDIQDTIDVDYEEVD